MEDKAKAKKALNEGVEVTGDKHAIKEDTDPKLN